MLNSQKKGLDRVKEHEFNCKIVAGTVRIANVEEFLSALKNIAHTHLVTIQALDAGFLTGEEHIQSAVEKAMRAVKRKRSITSDLGLEILLYAAGKRQIGRSLKMGVKEGEQTVALVIVGEGGEKDLEVVAEDVKRKTGLEEVIIQELESELDYDEHKRERIKEFFAITRDELQAVGEEKLKFLVLERVALVDVLK